MASSKRKALDLVKSVNKGLINGNAINPNQSLLLAVSGGQDSTCLLLLVSQLKGQWGWRVTVLHCNHLWAKGSLIAHPFVFKTAFLFESPALAGFALRQVPTEQRARGWRLAAFQHVSLFYNLNRVLTGHSSSDRLETSLFNLFRGCGLRGVSASSWRSSKTFKWFSRPRDCFFKGGQGGLRQACYLVTFTRHKRLNGCPVFFAWLVTRKGFSFGLKPLCRAEPALGQSKMSTRVEAKGFFRALEPLNLTTGVQSKSTVRRDCSRANHLPFGPSKQAKGLWCGKTKPTRGKTCSLQRLTARNGPATECLCSPACRAEVETSYRCGVGLLARGFSFCSQPHSLRLKAKVLFVPSAPQQGGLRVSRSCLGESEVKP